MKFRIADDAMNFVKSTASRNGVSEADVVRRALEAYRFLEDVNAVDGEIVFERGNGTLPRLVRF